MVKERIISYYPSASVAERGDVLQVELEGKTHRVELEPIALQCNRGINDCERVLTDMLLELGKPAAAPAQEAN